MKAPNPFVTLEEDGGKIVHFGFHLDEVTTRRYGIQPRVDLRLMSPRRVQDSGYGQMGVYWDLLEGGHGKHFDGFHVEPYFFDGKGLLTIPARR